jgi:hypothetical protein
MRQTPGRDLQVSCLLWAASLLAPHTDHRETDLTAGIDAQKAVQLPVVKIITEGRGQILGPKGQQEVFSEVPCVEKMVPIGSISIFP